MAPILAFLFYSSVLLLPKLTPEVIEPSQKICEEPSERVCPTCSSEQVIKNGSVHNGKPKYQCKSCGRQFVINPTNSPVSEEIKQLIDRLLLERISLRGIARVTQVSWSWLQDYVNQKLARTPRQVKILGKSLSKLVIECDVTCGHLLGARTIRFTSGLQLIVIREKLWGAISETELENQPINFGLLYQRFIKNVPLHIQTFGKPIR